jgi:hypothetical protein
MLAPVYRSSAVATLDAQIRQMVPQRKKRMVVEQVRDLKTKKMTCSGYIVSNERMTNE